MKATTSGFLVLAVVFFTVVDDGLCHRSFQNAPFTGLGSVRPLRGSSSFASSSSPPHSALNESELGVGWVSSMNSSSSIDGDDAHVAASNSSSSAVDVDGVPTNSSSSSSASSAVFALGTIFSNASTGGLGDPESTNSSASSVNVSAVEEELIETLEADQQVIVVGDVQLGELLCDSLVEAEDAPLLQFAVSPNETLLVNRTSYSVVSGKSFTGGVARRTWIGMVTDPEKTEDEALPRRVSMTWGEICDVETFSLEIARRHINGDTSLVKSLPCGLSGMEICIIEVALDFLPDSLPLTVDFNSTNGAAARRRLGGSRAGVDNQILPEKRSSGALGRPLPAGGRRMLQSTTVEIQVLVLYSDQALDLVGVSDVTMESMVSASFADVNVGFANSQIGINLTIVHQTSLPYDEGNSASGDKLDYMRENEHVRALRNEHGADLVLLVGELYDVCGIAYMLPDPLPWHGDWAYALVNPNCFSNLVIAHEFGHNLGCDHNREHAGEAQEYAHGYRYCSGAAKYTTIMSYTSGCTATRANYFANPDVSYLGRPTGTETENCARAVEENKEVVSNFRDDVRDAQESDSDDEDASDGIDFGDLWTRVKNWLFFVPIALVFYFLKRRCPRGRSDDG